MVSCALASDTEICMAIPPWTRQWSKIVCGLDQNRVRHSTKPTVILAERDLSKKHFDERLIAISV